ncbi:uncharacterized protein TNCV_2379571 [Trichonephila clavipes]|uniref:Uncharacterized protein n=1 Tax=Trichonephila clavipes TaxID=2585209 RepID=A0A8X6RLZ2_TRICX|nr:uncharacterized protein TNCV_2379571 [Trichonephila clavipes]
MDEQLKALLKGINVLKSGQEETKKRMKNMQRSQEETKELKEGIQNGLEEMQKSQEETKHEMQKGQGRMQKLVEEKIEKKVGEEIERVNEQAEESIEEVAGNFSQRFEDLEKKLLAWGKTTNENKFVPASAVPVPASPVSVKLFTYDGKTNWEVYKSQFCIISEANGWTKGVKACQLAASLTGEATEIKTRHQKPEESLQEYAFEIQRLDNLAFSDHPLTVRKVISLQYFVDGLKNGEIQKSVRIADVQDLKSALLYALKLEAATQINRRDRHSIRGARVTADEPCESRLIKEIEKLKEEMQTIKGWNFQPRETQL